jgi:hypothetical protein
VRDLVDLREHRQQEQSEAIDDATMISREPVSG